MPGKQHFIAALLMVIALSVPRTWADDGQPSAPPVPPNPQTPETLPFPSAATTPVPPGGTSALQGQNTTPFLNGASILGPAQWLFGDAYPAPEGHDVAARF